jgi:hypothetical protein
MSLSLCCVSASTLCRYTDDAGSEDRSERVASYVSRSSGSGLGWTASPVMPVEDFLRACWRRGRVRRSIGDESTED